MNKPELLAPAGDLSCLKTAVNVGADAVYFGGQAFSARAYAKNFGPEEIRAGIDYAHRYGVKAYCTVNTLLFNHELSQALEVVYDLYEAGVDALIIQDLGLAALLRQELPDLPLHGSTQMVVHNAAGAAQLQDLGFERVVLARECTAEDIKKIHQASPIELEVFIHGALCMGYSGNCLMSSFCGGRSGNRGACAQPCRQNYQLLDDQAQVVEEGHLLSMKDLCTLKELPTLLQLGISSLKIEGRMKKEAYIASTVGAYRKQIDACMAHQPLTNQEVSREISKMAQIYNRGGFTQGYLGGAEKKDLLSTRLANHKGIPLGQVKKVEKNRLLVNLDQPLALGDGYVLLDGEGTVLDGGYINKMLVNKEEVRWAKKGDLVELPSQVKKIPGGPYHIFKSYDNQLVKGLAREEKQIPSGKDQLDIYLYASVGAPLTAQVLASDQELPVTLEDEYIVQAANRQATDLEAVRKQLDRLGGTRFILGEVGLEAGENVFIPASVLNRVRRLAVEAFIEEGTNQEKRSREAFLDGAYTLLDQIPPQIKTWPLPDLAVTVARPDQAQLALAQGANHIIIKVSAQVGPFPWQAADIAALRAAGCSISAEEGPIVMPDYQKTSTDRLRQLANWGVSTCYISNISQLPAKQWYENLRGDYALNVTNDVTLSFWTQAGLSGLTLSPELSRDQIDDLSAIGNVPLEIIVAGRYPLLQSAYGSLMEARQTDSGHPAVLHQAKGSQFPCSENSYGDLLVLNGRLLSLYEHMDDLLALSLDSWRVEGAYLSQAELSILVEIFADALTRYAQGEPAFKATDADRLAGLMKDIPPADEQFTQGVF